MQYQTISLSFGSIQHSFYSIASSSSTVHKKKQKRNLRRFSSTCWTHKCIHTRRENATTNTQLSFSICRLLDFTQQIRQWNKPKFHLARHVTSRHVSTRHDTFDVSSRAHEFWLCRACRTARFDPLDTTSSTGSTRRTSCRVETWRAKWNLGYIP